MQQHRRLSGSHNYVSNQTSVLLTTNPLGERKEMNKLVPSRWYRGDSNQPLQAPINRGGSKDLQTVSTLTVTPKREDDGVRYRCVVWNRAMPEGMRLETTVTLSVNCKYIDWNCLGFGDYS